MWNILTDFNNWNQGNPIVNHASGVASISMRGNNGKDGPKYLTKVTKLEEPRFFHWRAKMMAGFIFTNDKVLKLSESSNGTRLIHKALYSETMARLFWKKLDSHVPSTLNSMNEALKKLAEKG